MHTLHIIWCSQRLGALCNCVVKKEKVINFLDNLSDEALKKEATTEAKSDTFSSIMKVVSVVNEMKHFDKLCNLVLQSLRHLCQRVSTREDIETFRLKMILRY